MKNCFLASVFFFMFLHATGQEKQIPFFPEAGVNTIDKTYAKRAFLFSEYQNFIEARLYEISDSLYALEIYYEKNNEVFKERQLLNNDEKTTFLNNLKEKMAVAGKATMTGTLNENNKFEQKDGFKETIVLDQRGRSGLLVTSTLVGLSYYGWALPRTLNVSSGKEFVAAYMLTSGAGFLIPYFGTRNSDVTISQFSMAFYGQTRGIAHGVILGNLLFDQVEYEDYILNSNEFEKLYDKRERRILGFGLLGSVGEGVAGFRLARKWNYSPGSASVFQMWGDVGTISGIFFADVFGFTENNMNGERDKLILGTVLSTSVAGYITGKLFADTRNYTVGDAIFYRSTITLGAFLPVVLVNYFEPDDETSYTSGIILGGLTGSYLGWKMLQSRDFTTGEGVLIALGEISGALIGLGTGYLISNDFNDDVILTSTAIGAVTGYCLFYRTFKHKALAFNNIKLDMNVNPMGLLTNQINYKNYKNLVNNSVIDLKLTF